MGKTDTIKQAIYYNTIQDLTQELLQQQDDPEIRLLSESLLIILKKARGPITRERAVTEAISSISGVQSASQQFRTTLSEVQERSQVKGMYQPVPGKPQPIRPGPLKICPVADCHYEQFLMQKGEEALCPTHHRELVLKPTRRQKRRT